MNLRITEISITDTYGIHGTVKFSPGSVTVISGDNGLGKSSVLNALLYVFNGGTDPSVIHQGAELSSVVFKLSDGTQIAKTTRPKRNRRGGEVTGYTSATEITQPDGTVRNAPMEYIRELGEAIAVDPGAILRIDAATVPGRKALAEILLKICPIAFSLPELDTATACRSSVDVKDANAHMAAEVIKDATGLEGMKKLVAVITEQRRRAGVLRDDSGGAVNSLRRSLPPDSGGADYGALLTEAEDFRREVESAIAERKREIDLEFADEREGTIKEQATEELLVNSEIDAKIRDLESERSQRHKAARDKAGRALAYAEGQKKISLEAMDGESAPQLEKAIAAVEQYRQLRDAHNRAAGLRSEIDRNEKIAYDQAWIYTQLTAVLERLEKLRRSKLDNLPAGIEITPDDVTVEGIPWHNVNRAKRVEVCVQLCALRSGALPFIITDDSEHMGQENWDALCQGIINSGYQLLAARVVSNSPLKIKTIP